MPLRQVMNYPNGEEVAMVDKLHLTNMLRAKVEHNLDGGLPLDVFPDKIQEIILNLSRHENFNVEYVASIIISAMAAAIGNSYQINIRNEWKDSPSLYMMLIGRPGLGKTPPLINVIGTVQTNMLHEVFRKEFFANGFLDRFIFIFPKDRKISRWRRNDNSIPKPDIAGQWATILNKVLEIPCTINEIRNVAEPKVLEMTEEAEVYFYDWYNNIIDNVNSIDDDADVESRSMKLNGHAGRLSLIFQIMKWAVGEEDMQPVSLSSVKSAIRMVDYYEDTYHRIQEILLSNTIGDVKEDWLSQLGNTFTASDAIAAAKIYEIPRRTVFYALKKLCQTKQPILEKTKHGEYRKIQHQTSNASCTIALSTQVEELQTKHSAKVHSANE